MTILSSIYDMHTRLFAPCTICPQPSVILLPQQLLTNRKLQRIPVYVQHRHIYLQQCGNWL